MIDRTHVDVTAILVGHAEGALAGISMRSMLEATRVAEATGLSIEMLVVLDRPDRGTREILGAADDHGARVIQVDFGDQGLVRNHVVEQAAGRYVAFLDGDDLWTENWLADAHAVCELQPGRIIAHPQVNWVFGNGRSLSFPPDQTSPSFEPATLRVTNSWDALCMAPIEAHRDHPFQARALDEGYAYEDWLWNLETVAAGFVHRVVPETIHFKRSREGSQFRHARANGSLTRPHAFHDYRWLAENLDNAAEAEPSG